MVDLWATIGCILLNEGFHRQLFDLARPDVFFEDLDDLRGVLRITNRLRLARWEIMVINEHLRKSYPDVHRTMLLTSPDSDGKVAPIRAGWSGVTPNLQDDFDLCAVVGLAAMDFQYRQDLFDATDPNDILRLNAFLTNINAENPIFGLSALELINLNRFMRFTDNGIDMVARLRDYHIQKWIQPLAYPCSGGYTETANAHFVYFAQSTLVRFVELNPDAKALLRDQGMLIPE